MSEGCQVFWLYTPFIPQMKRAVGREDESDSDRERRPWGKSRSEDWADPWARDNNKEREKGGKTKNKRRKVSVVYSVYMWYTVYCV